MPSSRWGAVELAARLSELDLSDGNIIGGEETNLTFGLNWDINQNVRCMVSRRVEGEVSASRIRWRPFRLSIGVRLGVEPGPELEALEDRVFAEVLEIDGLQLTEVAQVIQ